LGGEVSNTILPSLLLKFEYMGGGKKSYVKGGFLIWRGGRGGTISLLKKNS